VLAPAAWELARLITSIFIAFESMEIEQAKAMNNRLTAVQLLNCYRLTH